MLDPAAELLAEHGVDRVSLRDIGQAADVQLPLIGAMSGAETSFSKPSTSD